MCWESTPVPSPSIDSRRSIYSCATVFIPLEPKHYAFFTRPFSIAFARFGAIKWSCINGYSAEYCCECKNRFRMQIDGCHSLMRSLGLFVYVSIDGHLITYTVQRCRISPGLKPWVSDSRWRYRARAHTHTHIEINCDIRTKRMSFIERKKRMSCY